MKICTEEVKTTTFKQGDLYQGKISGKVFIATAKDELVCLASGDKVIVKIHSNYTDVTDQYCLQKIK